MASAKELLERLTIREIVENWALLRDARRWDRMDIHAPRAATQLACYLAE